MSTRVNPAWPQGQPWGQARLTLVYSKVDPGGKQGRPRFTPGLTLGSSRVDPVWHQGWPWLILDSFFGCSPNNPNLTSIQLKSTLTRKPSGQCFGGHPVNYIHVTWLVTVTCKLVIIFFLICLLNWENLFPIWIIKSFNHIIFSGNGANRVNHNLGLLILIKEPLFVRVSVKANFSSLLAEFSCSNSSFPKPL